MSDRHLAVVNSEGRAAVSPALSGSDRDYTRTVAAARFIDESKFGKFRLAEALALDIPERAAGRIGGADKEDVPSRLVAARRAMVEAGVVQRSVETLRRYRLVALWVNKVDLDLNSFRWLPKLSFSVHIEACHAGMSYEEFATGKYTTVNAIRLLTGVAPTDSPGKADTKSVAQQPPSPGDRKARLAAASATREAAHESAYQSMQSAPPGAQNNPMFWRAAKVEALIGELSSVNPEVAAEQLVSPAFRFFTGYSREWWSRFTAACEKRLAEELPDEQPVRRKPGRAPWAEADLDVRLSGRS